MPNTLLKIGPGDHGRRMSLDEFDTAEAVEGAVYELSRGVVTVVDVPNERHFAQVDEAHQQLAVYRHANPGVIRRIGGGTDCKILVAGYESERHPDLAVYKTLPPPEQVWSTWVPELVIEVVSPSSRHRDYEEKPEEYLRFGVAEYWIIDDERQEMLVHRRVAGRYETQVVRHGEVYRPTVLKGFAFDVAAVFAAARAAGT